MTAPLMILSVGAILFGFFSLGGRFGHFVEGALDPAIRHFHHEMNIVVMAVSTVAALGGIAVAAAIYYAQRPQSSVVRGALGPLPSGWGTSPMAPTCCTRCCSSASRGSSCRP